MSALVERPGTQLQEAVSSQPTFAQAISIGTAQTANADLQSAQITKFGTPATACVLRNQLNAQPTRDGIIIRAFALRLQTALSLLLKTGATEIRKQMTATALIQALAMLANTGIMQLVNAFTPTKSAQKSSTSTQKLVSVDTSTHVTVQLAGSMTK